MAHKFALVGCCLIGGLLAGCSQHGGLVRGQNPGDSHGPAYTHTSNGEMSPVYYDGPSAGVGECPLCPSACPPGDAWRPTHHHTWEYDAPKGLVYPPQNQQPAVYQYPYYTVKGPTDFFYTGQ